MMKIDSTRWGELSPLLDQVLELADEERVAWLEALRATRPDVAAELQTLLAELQALDDAGFLEGDPSKLLGQPSLVGQTFGAYTIEAPIGHGGMGSLGLARRRDGLPGGPPIPRFTRPAHPPRQQS